MDRKPADGQGSWELLTKVFGGGVRDWLVKQGRDLVAEIFFFFVKSKRRVGKADTSGRHEMR
jgi:hypothetical protein